VGLLLVSSASSFAQLVPGWNTKQFTFERLDACRVRLMRDVEIEGEKGSPNEGQKFFADDLELDTCTGDLTASGNVVFSTPETRVSADSGVFNTRTKHGTFTNATGIASLGERGEEDRSMFGTLEPDVYFYGETIDKIDVDKYRITRGGFTTCVQPTPRWEIVSGRATVNLDDYVIMRNAVLRVKDVPVFYLPVMYYPIQEDDRATGFLMPAYGRSTYRGQSISNAFFWAINRSQDATFMHDWFMSRGQGGGGEYRYVQSPQSQGDFRAYWLKEKESAFDTETGVVTEPARNNYRIQGNVAQSLPGGMRGRVRLDYFSDIQVEQLYNNNLYQSTFSTRSLGGGVSGSWGGLSMSGNYQRTETFTNTDDSFVTGSAPGVVASFSGRRLGSLPVYASVNVDAAHQLWEQRSGDVSNDLGLNRVDLLPSIRAPLSRLPYLSVNASIGYRMTYFSESVEEGVQVVNPVTRRYADMRAEFVGPVVSKVFTPNNAFAERLKHVVEPAFTVQRITSIDNQDSIPTTGSYEFVVGGVTRFTYGVTNRVLVRKGAGEKAGATPAAGPAGAPREYLSVGINQSYYTDEAASQFDGQYSYSLFQRRPSNYSTISLVARGRPSDALGLDFRMEYDPVAGLADPNNPSAGNTPTLVGLGMNGTVRTGPVEATAGWNKQNYGALNPFSSNHYIQQSTTLRLLQNRIGATVQFNYDIGRSTLLQQRYIANYSAQCCGIAFEYQSFNFANTSFPVAQDRRFNFAFTLAGVGTFSNFFGNFGGRSY
jgi:LPS-assembly protein